MRHLNNQNQHNVKVLQTSEIQKVARDHLNAEIKEKTLLKNNIWLSINRVFYRMYKTNISILHSL